MEQKISELTEKIYKEGVEKGEEQKKEILKAAQAGASKIKEDAEKEAAKITAEAQKQAEEMKRNIESEIKLSSQQAVSALKQKIIDILLVKGVEEKISADLSEPGFIKELLTTVVTNWKTGGSDEMSLEAILPDKLKGKLDKSLQNSLKKNMKGGVEISFSKNIKGGFQIGPKGGTFKVSLTDKDFNEFFKEYLRPKTRSFLFEE